LFRLMKTGLARRVVRTVGLFGLGLGVAQCGDRAALDPDTTPAHAKLSIQPRFSRAPGAPTVALSRVRASLVAQNGDSTVANAAFESGSATLQFEIPILGGPTEFLLNVEAFDTQNVLAYKFSKKITITPGEATTIAQPTLEYVAPDAAVTAAATAPSTNGASTSTAFRPSPPARTVLALRTELPRSGMMTTPSP